VLLAQHGKIKKLEDTMAIYRNGVGIFSGHSSFNRSLKFLLTLFLIQSAVSENPTLVELLNQRIKNTFNYLLHQMTEKDLLFLRVNNNISENIDHILLDLLNKMHIDLRQAHIEKLGNTNFRTLIKHILNRIINKLRIHIK
jgi:hypothetical protein